MRRRQFIAGLGGAAAWPVTARAQQRGALPVVAFITGGSLDVSGRGLAAFRAGLSEFGYVDGQNIWIEYHGLDGQYNRAPAVTVELARRRVAVIATLSPPVALAAKNATATVPIVFGVGEDPVKLGLVASLARPGGNATGVNFFVQEVVAKRFALLHELAPKVDRLAMLVNPGNITTAEATLRGMQDFVRRFGLQIDVLNASTSSEIDAAFRTMVCERIGALFVAGDGFFTDRSVQFATLATRNGISTSFANPAFVEVGGLMSYGTDFADTNHQVGVYTGQILKGIKPTDLPVVQSTKFEFVINLQTARALDITVPQTLLVAATKVIE
jgi:putative tryptophan/tyrosine transport system substrate-binding protein